MGLRKLIEPLELCATCLAGVQVRDEVEMVSMDQIARVPWLMLRSLYFFLVTRVLLSS